MQLLNNKKKRSAYENGLKVRKMPGKFLQQQTTSWILPVISCTEVIFVSYIEI